MNMVVKEKERYTDKLGLKLAQLPFLGNSAGKLVGIY